MTAPQIPGDQERDRLAEEYANTMIGMMNLCSRKEAFLIGYDKAMDRTAALVERKDRQLSAFEQKNITLEAEVKRLVEVLEFYAQKRLYVNVGLQSDLYKDQGTYAREALAPRRKGSGA